VTADLRLFTAAAVCFAAFALLGLHVSRRPLGRLDSFAVYFRGQATRLARAFTISGRAAGVTTACVMAFVVFLLLRKPLWIPLAITVSQVTSQGLIEACKALYVRTRPDYWLVGMDAGHSYPSGHSSTAIAFVMAWALVVAFAGLYPPVRDCAIAVFALWALGIMWSRLALGAHYLTDVFGGMLFGTGWLCLMCALLLHFAGFVLRAPHDIW